MKTPTLLEERARKALQRARQNLLVAQTQADLFKVHTSEIEYILLGNGVGVEEEELEFGPKLLPTKKKRQISAEARARISAAQRERWKRQKSPSKMVHPGRRNIWTLDEDDKIVNYLKNHDSVRLADLIRGVKHSLPKRKDGAIMQRVYVLLNKNRLKRIGTDDAHKTLLGAA